jgi:hypothetical protein
LSDGLSASFDQHDARALSMDAAIRHRWLGLGELGNRSRLFEGR